MRGQEYYELSRGLRVTFWAIANNEAANDQLQGFRNDIVVYMMDRSPAWTGGKTNELHHSQCIPTTVRLLTVKSSSTDEVM